MLQLYMPKLIYRADLPKHSPRVSILQKREKSLRSSPADGEHLTREYPLRPCRAEAAECKYEGESNCWSYCQAKYYCVHNRAYVWDKLARGYCKGRDSGDQPRCKHRYKAKDYRCGTIAF